MSQLQRLDRLLVIGAELDLKDVRRAVVAEKLKVRIIHACTTDDALDLLRDWRVSVICLPLDVPEESQGSAIPFLQTLRKDLTCITPVMILPGRRNTTLLEEQALGEYKAQVTISGMDLEDRLRRLKLTS
jgi:hypothetical protein